MNYLLKNGTELQGDHNTDDNAVLRAKIMTMVFLFAISMVCGLLPMLISTKWNLFSKSPDPNMRNSNQIVMGLLAFGGGVLFATTFLHLLPEVDKNIKMIQDEEGKFESLPSLFLGSLIMCCGFFMMYLVEELVHVYINRRENKTANTSFTRVLSIRSKGAEPGNSHAADTTSKDVEAKSPSPKGNNLEHSHGHSHFEACTEDDSIVAALRGLLIVLALSIHELFEGLAVGLESSAAKVWFMFGAVSAHKYIIAFCIGVELMAAGTKRWLSALYVFTFSFVSALGIGIGVALVGGDGAATAGFFSTVLQGLACGTLVYVVFFEVWRQDRTGLLQFACSVAGFALIAGLELVELSAASSTDSPAPTV